jgi:outer membrane lipoprotein-sorting protein
MKKILFSFMLFCLSTVANAQDPTAEQLIDKYLTAIGGKDALAKIEDMTVSSTSEMQRNGNTMTMENEVKVKKNKFVNVSYMMGNEANRITSDGSKVASVRNMMGNTDKRLAEGKDAVPQIMQGLPFPELYYSEYNIQKTVVGKENVNGKEAWKVEISTPEGKKWYSFFDVESGLKVKAMSTTEGGPRGPSTMSVVFADYKEVNGVKVPYTRLQNFGQMEMKAEVQSVKFNKGVKDSAFDIKP